MSIGTQKRDFFQPILLSRMIRFLLEKNYWDYDLINVGSCKPKSVIELANDHIKFRKKKYNLLQVNMIYLGMNLMFFMLVTQIILRNF